ncbi:unnamed protein product, partial [Symbiodinium microadriaticum]
MEKNSESLRARLRDFTKIMKDQKAEISKLTEAVTEQQDKVKTLQEELDQARSTPVVMPPAEATPTSVVRQTTAAPVAAVETTPSAISTEAAAAPPAPGTTEAPVTDGASASNLKSLREDLLRRMAESKAKKTNAAKNGASAPVATAPAGTVKHAAPPDTESDAPNAKRARTTTAPVAITNPETPAPQQPSQPTQASAQATKKCYFFSTPKGCRKGDACPYLHETEAPVTVSAPPLDATVIADEAVAAEEPVVSTTDTVETGTVEEAVATTEGDEGTGDGDDIAEMVVPDTVQEGEVAEDAGAVDGDDAPEMAEEGRSGEDIDDTDGMEQSADLGKENPTAVEAVATTAAPLDTAVAPAKTSAPSSLAKFLTGSVPAPSAGPLSKTLKGNPGTAFGSQSSIFGGGFKTGAAPAGSAGGPATPATGSIFGSFAKKLTPVAPLNPFAKAFAPPAAGAAPTVHSGSDDNKTQEAEGVADDISVTEGGPDSAAEGSVSSPGGRSQPSSPFINMRPPSPNSSSVRLQFGSSSTKSLPVPSNPLSPSTSSGTPLFKGFGGSLFKVATPAATAAAASTTSANDLSAAGQPIRALPGVSVNKTADSVEPVLDEPEEEAWEDPSNAENTTEASQHDQSAATIVSTKVAMTAEERRQMRMAKFGGGMG